MSRVFDNPPQGLNYDVYGGSVPNSMLYRIKQIEGLSKQTLSIVPKVGKVWSTMVIKQFFLYLRINYWI
jgi:hypothetical protein